MQLVVASLARACMPCAQVAMALVIGSFARLTLASPQYWRVVSEHNFLARSRQVRRPQLVEVVGIVPVLG